MSLLPFDARSLAARALSPPQQQQQQRQPFVAAFKGVVGMYLLHSCRDHRAFKLWYAVQALIILVSCSVVALPPPERGDFHLVLVSPGTLLLRAASGGQDSPRSNSDTYRRTCHNAPCSFFVCHPGVGNDTFIK